MRLISFFWFYQYYTWSIMYYWCPAQSCLEVYFFTTVWYLMKILKNILDKYPQNRIRGTFKSLFVFLSSTLSSALSKYILKNLQQNAFFSFRAKSLIFQMFQFFIPIIFKAAQIHSYDMSSFKALHSLIYKTTDSKFLINHQKKLSKRVSRTWQNNLLHTINAQITYQVYRAIVHTKLLHKLKTLAKKTN